jgi:glycosyltransferase involved in cell wall biosynthesis
VEQNITKDNIFQTSKGSVASSSQLSLRREETMNRSPKVFKTTPLVSVIIPVFNRASVVAGAVHSALRQSFQDLEVIVVDDGSQDASTRSLREIAESDSRVRLLRHEQNRGAQAARNTGARAARGKWLAFLDSDDTWMVTSVEARLDVAKMHNVQVVYSAGLALHPDGQRRPLYSHNLTCHTYRQALRGGNALYQGLLISAAAFREIGGFDESILAYQEWDSSILLARRHDFGFVPEPTFIYDCRPRDAISSDPMRGARGYEQIVKKHFWAILLHVGPQAISNHYEQISDFYRLGGEPNTAQNRKLKSWIWWPIPTRLIWRLGSRVKRMARLTLKWRGRPRSKLLTAQMPPPHNLVRKT